MSNYTPSEHKDMINITVQESMTKLKIIINKNRKMCLFLQIMYFYAEC